MEKFIEFRVKGNTLRGILHVPDSVAESGVMHQAIVWCHGFTGNKIGLHRILVKAARFFCDQGYVILRFDFSGCGDSDGTHQEITIDRQVEEAQAALNYMQDLPYVRKEAVYMAGLSMGGAIAALASSGRPELAGLILWAPVADFVQDIGGIVGKGLLERAWQTGMADFAGFALGQPLLESFKHYYPLLAVKRFQGLVLVIQGSADELIPIENSQAYKAARQEAGLSCEVCLIPGADHTFSSLEWEKELFFITRHWLANQIVGGVNDD